MNTPDTAPLVTIAIPAYNRGHLLRLAIESALCQTYHHLEVLVVDNASEEDLAGLVCSFDSPLLRYVRNPTNIGMIPNFNRCLTLAQGAIVNLLHSDDVLAADAAERAVQWFSSCADLGIVCSGPQRTSRCVPGGVEAATLLASNVVAPVSSVFLARRCVEQCGLYDPSYHYSADLEYFPRIARSFGVVVVDGLVTEPDHSARAMLQTWRQRDFLSHFEKVRTAAWRHAGLEGDQLRSRVCCDLASACLYIAGYVWRHGAARGDAAVGRMYFRSAQTYAPGTIRPTKRQTIRYWSSYVPFGKQVVGHAATTLRGMRRLLARPLQYMARS